MTAKRPFLTTRDMAYIALMAALIAVCSWISIPLEIPITLQTFGVFCALGLLGGKRGTMAILVYIVLGAVGIPVFAGFTGGMGKLLGVTGGYIVGFLAAGAVYWLIEKLMGTKLWVAIVGFVLGNIACYIFGSLWFMAVYASSAGAIGFAAVMAKCVVPYVPFDVIKLVLAVAVTRPLRKLLKLDK